MVLTDSSRDDLNQSKHKEIDIIRKSRPFN